MPHRPEEPLILILDRDGREKVDTCSGPDDLGWCPKVAAGDELPCAGRQLAPGAARGLDEWRIHVPAGRVTCPVASLAGTRRSRWWVGLQTTSVAAAGVALVLAAGAFGVSYSKGSTTSTSAAAAAPPAPAMAMGGSSAGADATIDTAAKPGADWKPFDASLAPAPGATVHNVTFHIQDRVMEVAPGVRQLMWTFNGQVPGPILRGHVGDVFNVTLVNDVDMPHSIDFHASQTSMDTDMRSIGRGQSLVYQFKAQYAGIFMYHCGTAPALLHIGSGMYGAVVVDPPGLARVDHEYVMVQSELYLGPPGKSADFAKMTADKPDAVVFNGYYNQYKYAPIMVSRGDRLRIWVIDDGPSDISSFHVVGTIFDTVYKEGGYLLRRGDAGGSQALDLMPAQGGFVEFTVTRPGMYAMVSHKFADANNGALGIIHAM